MAQFEHLQVFQSMSRSANARLHAMAELGNGLAVARWSNAHDARDYLAPQPSHTVLLSGRRQPAPSGASNPATRVPRTNCASCRPNINQPGSSTAKFNLPIFI
jgi:AraC family transcriptional regulator